MTTLTMRYINGHFVVAGPDIEPAKFNRAREAKDWCQTHEGGIRGVLAQVEGVGQAGRGGLTSLSSCRAHEHVPIFCEFSSRLAAFSARSLLPSERHLRGTIANV